VKSDADEQRAVQELEALRKDIDKIDVQILSLLLHRQETALSIGERKKALGLDIVDPFREVSILQSLSAQENALLKKSAIRSIFLEIMSASREVQKAPVIAYLGPEATFSHQAAQAMFGHSASFMPAESMKEVFELVERDQCTEGVVPMENSLEGPVGAAHDLLYTHNLKIRAEFILRIRHHLLSKAKRLEDVVRIYSHPMAFFQCGAWLRKHLPNAMTIDLPSTAAAAVKAAENPTSAAIGSTLASSTYGLSALASDIEDSPDNLTRFISVGKTPVGPTGADKTSFILSVRHEPGALACALEPLSSRKINMTRIASRPLKGRSWKYLFFLDVEGSLQDGKVAQALTDMQSLCSWIKELGSYPKGGDPWE